MASAAISLVSDDEDWMPPDSIDDPMPAPPPKRRPAAVTSKPTKRGGGGRAAPAAAAGGRRKAKCAVSSSSDEEDDSDSGSNFSDAEDEVVKPKRRTARQAAVAAAAAAAASYADEDEDEDASSGDADAPPARATLAPLSPGAQARAPNRASSKARATAVGAAAAAPAAPAAAPTTSASSSWCGGLSSWLGGSGDASSSSAAATADAAPTPRAEPTDSAVRSYQRARAASVKSRSYDLRSVAAAKINTGRTIKPLASWTGLWPPLREFMQNTVDHLDLFSAGSLHPALRIDVRNRAAASTEVAFVCGDEDVCTFRVSADELVVVQRHTFPLHTRALDTGVNDTTKGGERTAGGFGDGFKTAMVALLALPHGACRALVWDFVSGGTRVRWTFAGARREAIGTFAKSTVLEVAISKHAHAAHAAHAATDTGLGDDLDDGVDQRRAEEVAPPLVDGDNVMVQSYRVDGIGHAFLAEALPRFQVFWSLDPGSLLSTKRGDFLADAASQPSVLPSATLGGSLHTKGRSCAARKPWAGVYIRGIWVRKPPIEGTLMSFLGKLNVSGRDRNDVDGDELLQATFHTLEHTEQRQLRLRLLEPLRQPSLPPSWLTRTPRFFNQLLEQHNDFFVHECFGVPRGALFVSKRTTESKDPFIKWASAFLAARGAPILALEPKANKHLFQEVSEAELEERCVKELLQDAKRANAAPQAAALKLKSAFGVVLRSLKLERSVKIHFSADVSVAFVHGANAFLPLQPLTRALLIGVLGVVQRKLSYFDEAFTYLTQAIFETIPNSTTPLTDEQLAAAVSRAKQVEQEAKAFLAGRPLHRADADKAAADKATADKATADKADANGKGGKRKAPAASSSVTDLTSDVEDDAAAAAADGAHKRGRTATGGGGSSSRGGGLLADQSAALAEQVAAIHRQRDGGRGGVIPAAAFEEDGAEAASECLQPNSALLRTPVCEGAGGGVLHADASSAGRLGGAMPAASQAALRAIREALGSAKKLLGRAVPSLQRLIDDVVCEGFDAANTSYLGFCSSDRIIINLCPLLERHEAKRGGTALPADLAHELLLTVVHEVAHMLQRGGGHGPEWRATQDRLTQAVMAKAFAAIGADGIALCQVCDVDH